MRSSTYRLADAPHGDGKLVHYSPGERGRPRVVGFVRPLPGGGFRARSIEEDRICVAPSQSAAAAGILPDDGFPELCVVCGKNEPIGDAAGFEYRGRRGRIEYAPSELDDTCEDCLPAAIEDFYDGYEP
jgi:hypothetical protein